MSKDERREGVVGTRPLGREDSGTEKPLRPSMPWGCGALPPGPMGRVSAAIAVCLLFSGLVWAGDSGIGQSASVTLQNDKIFCWGRSFEIGIGANAGETYPDHLERILGRDVEHSQIQDMRWRSSEIALEDVSYFDEHKYGVVTMRTNNDGPEFPWNETEANLRELVRRLQNTGAVVVMFETGPLWDLEGQMTTTDEQCYTNTSAYALEGVENPEFVCVTVDGETQTAKYYELWGDTVFCKMAEEEGAYFIPEYVVDCLEEGEETCPRITRLHPDLECDDDAHPNDIGYGVLAERIAEYLVGWGLAEYAVDLEGLSEDLPGEFARAEEMIEGLEERNHPLGEELGKEYRMARFVYDHGFLYTANRTLAGGVLPRVSSVYENWDEVQGMFVQAAECIEILKQAGDTRNENMCRAFYSQAESNWAEYDYLATHTKLGNIIEKCPEAPTMEEEYVTMFCEDFDTDSPQVEWELLGTGTANVRDGCIFLNISDQSSGDHSSMARLLATFDVVESESYGIPVKGRWLHTSLEIRMRCSDDNKLNSDVGGGLRYWGLSDHWSHPPNMIYINSWSPEAGPLAGFTGEVQINDSGIYDVDISEVDMREWHTYTVLWEPDGVTFLVDGEVVGSADESPSVPMFPIVNVWNLIGLDESLTKMGLEHNISLQVDYMKLFAPAERYEAWSEEIAGLISQAEGSIGDLEEKGFECQEQEGNLDLIKGNWVEGNYNYAAAKSPLLRFISPLNNFLDLLSVRGPVVEAKFSEAEECIEILKSEGMSREATMSTADLSRAEKAWWSDLDYEATCTALDNIVARCPEPVLPLLSLLVVPLLFQRIGGKVDSA